MEERTVLLSNNPSRPAAPVWSFWVVAGLMTAGGVLMGTILLARAADHSGGVQLRDCVRAGLLAVSGLAFGGLFLGMGVAIRIKPPRVKRLSDLVMAEPPPDRAEMVAFLRSVVGELHEVLHQSSQPALAPPSLDAPAARESALPPGPAPGAAGPLDISQQQRLLETLLDDAAPAARPAAPQPEPEAIAPTAAPSLAAPAEKTDNPLDPRREAGDRLYRDILQLAARRQWRRALVAARDLQALDWPSPLAADLAGTLPAIERNAMAEEARESAGRGPLR